MLVTHHLLLQEPKVQRNKKSNIPNLFQLSICPIFDSVAIWFVQGRARGHRQSLHEPQRRCPTVIFFCFTVNSSSPRPVFLARVSLVQWTCHKLHSCPFVVFLSDFTLHALSGFFVCLYLGLFYASCTFSWANFVTDLCDEKYGHCPSFRFLHNWNCQSVGHTPWK